MKLNDSILDKIKDIAAGPINTTSIYLGRKTKDGQETGEIGIVFSVEKKVSSGDIPKDQLIPKTIKVDGHDIVTDVVECEPLKTMACYTSSDPDVTKLQNLPTAPVALKGGQEMRQFPTGWVNLGGGNFQIQIGTLGFFAKDLIDNKVVAVTNSHVACYRKTLASQRNISEEQLSPNNTGEQYPWVGDGNLYTPGGSFRNNSANARGMNRIKRYEPQDLYGINYVDAALLIPEPNYVDNNSYQVWQPTSVPTYPASLPFASTAELNNLLVSNPRVYSTGRSTGPKGWGNFAGCRIRVTAVGAAASVTDSTEGFVASWQDLIYVQYEDLSTGPMAGGDSGSAVMAEIGGVMKIIGLFFAGASNLGALCRIDRIVTALNIGPFTTPTNSSIPTPNFFSGDFATYGSQKTISRNGKTYYQIGVTSNVYNS